MFTTADEARIIQKVEQSFLPLRCVAQIFDYSHRLRFKVFNDADEGIVEMADIVIAGRDEKLLDELIAGVREIIIGKGYRLT